MSKDHFPVNDKTIADVNKANARAYDASIQVGPNMGATGKEKEKLMRPSEREKRGIPQEGAEIVIGKKKSSGDHVRESSQEKGEQHDAGRSLTSLEQERGTGKAKPRKEDVAKQGAAWKREQERTFAKYGK